MASQTTFVDPSSTTPQANPANIGNGTMSTPLGSSSTLTENFTVTCTVPGGSGVAQFSVVGSVSGNTGTALSNTEFVDTNKKVRFTITAGGISWAMGDKFTFSTTQGTPLNKANFDALVNNSIVANSDNADKVDGVHAWTDGAGNLIAFPAGTKMVFFQTSAPTGWTQNTNQNDKALRVVSGSGGGSGGSSLISSGNTGGFVLTINEMPQHSHNISDPGHQHNLNMAVNANQSPYSRIERGDADGGIQVTNLAGTGISVQNAGGGAPHSHALALAYIDVIVCSKD